MWKKQKINSNNVFSANIKNMIHGQKGGVNHDTKRHPEYGRQPSS
jgi:hypothetical protein